LEIDDEFEFGRLYHRHVGRLGTLTSPTPCRRMRLRLAIRDQFARAITPPQHTRLHSKAAGENHEKPGGFALAPQTSEAIVVGAVELGRMEKARSDLAIIHLRFAGWYQATRHALRMSALGQKQTKCPLCA
jgi:hypothetical protein